MAAGPGTFVPTLRQISFLYTDRTLCPLPSCQMYANAQGCGIPAGGTDGNYRWRCAVLYSPRRAAAIPYPVCDWGGPVTIDEHSARRIHELEETVRVLEDQNVQLKIAAREFGALAERLNARLMAESRRSWRVSVREAVAGIAGQVGFSRLRT